MDPETYKVLADSLQGPKGSIKELLTSTLNMMIEAEFEAKIGAKKSERTSTRKGYRCGYRTRRFDTTFGTIILKIPHPLKGGYVPSFLRRYQRYEQDLKDTIAKAYVNGVSTGRMKHLVRAMGVEGISRGQVSRITSELNTSIEAFRCRSLSDLDYPVLFIDAMFERVREQNRGVYKAILTVMGMSPDGRHEVLAVEAAPNESYDSYARLLKGLLERGLKVPRLVVSDGAAGLLKAMSEFLPCTKWQRCQVHFMRNVVQTVRNDDKPAIVADIKRVWHTADKSLAIARAFNVIRKWEHKYPTATECLKQGILDTLTYMDFAGISPKKIKTTNIIERLHRTYRERSKTIGIFPNAHSCLKLFILLAIKYNSGYTIGISQ